MPTKLKFLVGSFALSALMSALTGHWFMLAYCVGVTLGIVRGNEGVRTLLRMVSGAGVFLQTGMGVLAILAGLAGGLSIAGFVTVIGFTAFGALSSGFSYWCLGEPDVQHWMYEKALGEVA